MLHEQLQEFTMILTKKYHYSFPTEFFDDYRGSFNKEEFLKRNNRRRSQVGGNQIHCSPPIWSRRNIPIQAEATRSILIQDELSRRRTATSEMILVVNGIIQRESVTNRLIVQQMQSDNLILLKKKLIQREIPANTRKKELLNCLHGIRRF